MKINAGLFQYLLFEARFMKKLSSTGCTLTLKHFFCFIIDNSDSETNITKKEERFQFFLGSEESF